MSGKATATAPANIAFIKYWGVRDAERVIPQNRSISMTLERCVTRTTAACLDDVEAHEVLLRGADGVLRPASEPFAARVVAQLERVRQQAGTDAFFRVATENSFPAAAGIASSASGFAALSLASAAAAGLALDGRGLSDLARRSGSGSAARSALGGYVEWPAGFTAEEGYATAIAPCEHWALADVIAVVDAGPKAVSSTEGHRRAPTSPFFEARLSRLDARLAAVRAAISERSLERLGPVIEEEALELHLIAMSARPPAFYWRPHTLSVLAAVRALREDGLAAWSTMDAGPNVHVICSMRDEAEVARRLAATLGVHEVIRDRCGPGPRLTNDDLF